MLHHFVARRQYMLVFASFLSCLFSRLSFLVGLSLFILLWLLTGCSVGPGTIQANRLDYNIALQKSNNEEMVVNLVRARYSEPLYFLQTGSIASSFSYAYSMGVGAAFMRNLRGPIAAADTYTSSLGAEYAERPTVTYTPLQGETAVRQLQVEMSLGNFLVLTRMGYSIESLLWVTVTRIGSLHNIGEDIGTGEFRQAKYSEFLKLARILHMLQMRGDLEFIDLAVKERGAESLTMQLRFIDEEEAKAVGDLLGIETGSIYLPDGTLVTEIELTTLRDLALLSEKNKDRLRVPIKLKSFFEMIVSLSSQVEVPEEKQEKGIARPVASIDEGLMKVGGLHMGLIRVKSKSARPVDSYVAVPYRNRWYYIDDTDLRSKSYMMLIGSIFSLQSGDLQPVTPLLTIPTSN